ncbi:hypothetical protein PR202_ga06797 [Eleusine coracana subsp. coracana]|uniref:POTRA domain-containing protein n=1 Tax=Eleusine coracana subsp. coracana TaxID=191504 RepID=A0AAV5BW15_ELECO|nr:hypothetical protein PR202_ga06797 [Eleusine coracana subsp. coracana]
MGRRRDARFVSSGVKLPPAAAAAAPAPDPAPAPALLSAALPFAHIGRAIDAAVGRGREVFASAGIKLPSAASPHSPSPAHPFADIGRAVDAAARRLGACLPRIPIARADTAPPLLRRHGKDGGGGEERVLISEVAVRGKDGEPLERPELEAAAAAALRACRPNAALTVREVQEDVHRVVESGLFRSCMPVAVDTRDGIRLVFEVLLLSSSSPPPSTVSYAEILSGGILSGEPTIGKTQPETILRQLTTKKGQAYNRAQVKRDVETILTMGIMEDVTIIPQPVGDTSKVDLVMNLVERTSGGFSAGGGISSGITNGPLSGLIGSFAYSHRNVFGRNKKLNLSLERGQIDSIFRLNYTDPWIDGDNKRTSRTVMIQNSRTPGTLVHGGDHPDHGPLTIGRVTAGIEYSRPFRPKWSGTLGLIFQYSNLPHGLVLTFVSGQHAGARDDKGNPVIRDFYNSQLTASIAVGMLTMTHYWLNLKVSTQILETTALQWLFYACLFNNLFVFNVEQGLPVLPEWLSFNRVTARLRQGYEIGPARLLFSASGGHVEGNFSPHEAFAIGGTNSVRGYEEGAVGSGRSYAVGSGEVSCRMFGPLEGVVFADYGSDLGSGPKVPGDPAGARGKPGTGYGYGVGIRVDSPLGPLRLEYALNDKQARRFHFGVGYRN